MSRSSALYRERGPLRLRERGRGPAGDPRSHGGSPSHAADIKTLMSRRDATVDIAVPAGTEITETKIMQLGRTRLPTPHSWRYTQLILSHHRTGARQPLNAVRTRSESGSCSRNPRRETRTRFTGRQICPV